MAQKNLLVVLVCATFTLTSVAAQSQAIKDKILKIVGPATYTSTAGDTVENCDENYMFVVKANPKSTFYADSPGNRICGASAGVEIDVPEGYTLTVKRPPPPPAMTDDEFFFRIAMWGMLVLAVFSLLMARALG